VTAAGLAAGPASINSTRACIYLPSNPADRIFPATEREKQRIERGREKEREREREKWLGWLRAFSFSFFSFFVFTERRGGTQLPTYSPVDERLMFRPRKKGQLKEGPSLTVTRR